MRLTKGCWRNILNSSEYRGFVGGAKEGTRSYSHCSATIVIGKKFFSLVHMNRPPGLKWEKRIKKRENKEKRHLTGSVEVCLRCGNNQLRWSSLLWTPGSVAWFLVPFRSLLFLLRSQKRTSHLNTGGQQLTLHITEAGGLEELNAWR